MRLPLPLLLLLFPLLLALSCIDHSYASGQCLSDQKTFLLQLKQNLSFKPPSAISKLTSWDLKTDCCSTWDGVGCDGDGHVITLDLHNKSISSVAQWGSLFELKYLIGLNLSQNSFNSSTPIPSGLERLANLEYLNLSNSGFEGQIPIDVSRMKRLVSLDLSTLFGAPLRLDNPNLTTLVRNLSELTELCLDGVNISMHGTEWSQALSSALPNLQVLSLSNCDLSGPIHQSLSNLRSLSTLRLDLNKISDEIPEFIQNLTNLSFLYLSACDLRGKFPEKIFQLPFLKSLDVAANPQLQGLLPDFPKNRHLQNIVLSNTNFSGKLPESIGNLLSLCRLALASCGFNESIPSSMSNLTKLEYLDLSYNKFSGTIPNFGSSVNLTFINLAHNHLAGPISSSKWDENMKLVSLYLRNNSLNGTIPSSLFALPKLCKLDLSQNRFTGQLSGFPKGSSLMLDTLDLSNNMLEGLIPSSIFDVTSLKFLALSSNNINATIDFAKFQNMRNLSSLDLSGINVSITTSVSNFALLPSFSILKLGSCNLRLFPEFLRNQSNLTRLDLSNNQIGGKIPNWIGKIGNENLMFLNLSYNLLQNPDQPLPGSLFNSLSVVDLRSNLLHEEIPILPPSAIFIDYSMNNIASSIPEDIGSYLNFSIFFSLSGNHFKGEIPSSLCHTEYLQVLDLSNNSLTGMIPRCLGYNTILKVLNLRSNKLNGTMPQIFEGKCSLRTLDLNGNTLEGKVPMTLARCKHLEVLDLGNNQMNGLFPCWLGEMQYLRVLVLRSNRFSGNISYKNPNTTFKNLQIIDLSSNNFMGNLPASRFSRWLRMMTMEEAELNNKHSFLKFRFLELSRLYYQDAVTVTSKGLQMELVKILTIFNSIDLSNNMFVGGIPEEIGNLTALHVLNLSHNALTGPIPPSLGDLTQLESLDLSTNKLTGMIPSELMDLTFLSVLNLSFNHLVGSIPQGSQLQTFNENLYEGNDGLCGPPLKRKCSSIPQFLPLPVESKAGFDWEFIVTGVGFGGGLAWIVAPLWLWTEGRKWFDRQFHKMLLLMFPSIQFQKCDAGKVDAVTDESLDEELTDDDEFTESTYSFEIKDENGHGRGRYCLHCTKLDISIGRAIHDPECIHPSPPDSSLLQNPNL